MNDMRAAITPKSDQLNSDDLISGEITVRITGVSITPGQEQPVAISYEGDNGKPYKPCKSMSRLLVAAWGADSKRYVGRSMTLFRDSRVKWAGMDVGGIRISHMSDIPADHTMALTVTKGNKRPYTVKPLLTKPATTVSSVAAPATANEPAIYVTPAQAEELEDRVNLTNSDKLAFLKFAGATKFREIPAGKYAALNELLRKKETGK